MISEQIEFQISQYVDGTLSTDDRLAVDELLAADAQARQVLSDYRRLNAQLTSFNAGPVLDWDQLTERISAGIDHPPAAAVAGRIGFSFASWMRIAAAFLVTATLWIAVRHQTNPVKPPAMQTPPSSIDVEGPQSEIATGPAVEDVQVKPSQMAAANQAPRYGEGVIDRGPSKVVISGLTPPAKKNSHLR